MLRREQWWVQAEERRQAQESVRLVPVEAALLAEFGVPELARVRGQALQRACWPARKREPSVPGQQRAEQEHETAQPCPPDELMKHAEKRLPSRRHMKGRM